MVNKMETFKSNKDRIAHSETLEERQKRGDEEFFNSIIKTLERGKEINKKIKILTSLSS